MSAPLRDDLDRRRPAEELRRWIRGELEMYVKGMITDSDYETLERNLYDIAQAHAKNLKRSVKMPLKRATETARPPEEPAK